MRQAAIKDRGPTGETMNKDYLAWIKGSEKKTRVSEKKKKKKKWKKT